MDHFWGDPYHGHTKSAKLYIGAQRDRGFAHDVSLDVVKKPISTIETHLVGETWATHV